MAEHVKNKHIFTYTGFHEEIDSVNLRVLAELRHDPRLSMSELGRRFLVYGSTTTSIIQSTRVPLRPPPLPEEATLE